MNKGKVLWSQCVRTEEIYKIVKIIGNQTHESYYKITGEGYCAKIKIETWITNNRFDFMPGRFTT